MVSKVRTLQLFGLTGKVIEVEAAVLAGLGKLVIVGLPDRALAEAKERVLAGLIAAGYSLPYFQFLVNLAPASLEKRGTGLDLAICTALLLAARQLSASSRMNLQQTLFLGEVGLSGELKPLPALAALLIEAETLGFRQAVIPVSAEALPKLKKLKLYPLSNLSELHEVMSGKRKAWRTTRKGKAKHSAHEYPFSFLAQRPQLGRVLALAALGRFNLLLDGPPGSGKTTLLKYFNHLLPPLDEAAGLEVFKIYALAEVFREFEHLPPQRQPHHTASDAALLGGGTPILPGEISLAHRGVLFLDEIAEFNRRALDALRQPLLDKVIQISRARYKVSLPADFQLIGTRNPCPCGWYSDPSGRCQCDHLMIKRYQAKLTGPLLDRIHLKVRVLNTPLRKVSQAEVVTYAELFQRQLTSAYGQSHSRLDKEGPQLLLNTSAKQMLSSMQPRFSIRGLRLAANVARALADLDLQTEVTEGHVLEATNYFYLS